MSGILIVGDLALDEYRYGESTRLAPEAPVPVVVMDGDSYVTELPGCAGNVASNVASLGGTPILVGIVGNDRPGHRLRDRLVHSKVSINYVVPASGHQTLHKIRVLGNHHLIVRMDYERIQSHEGYLDLIGVAMVEMAPDVLYFADYDKGALTSDIIRALITMCKERGITTIADPKVRNFRSYAGVDIVKPNLLNGSAGVGMTPHDDPEDIVVAIGTELECNVVLTIGSYGMMTYVEGVVSGIAPHYVEVSDLSGAGDTAGAALGVGIARGLGIDEAALLANAAASVVVQKVGTAVCTIDELEGVLGV